MTRRITALLLALLMVIGMMAPAASAASTLEEAMSDVSVYAKNTDLNWLTMNGSVKSQHYTYYNYRTSSGETKEIPAYCVDPRLYGVPALVSEGTPIHYSASETVSDPKVMGIIANGYPHIDMTRLGVNSVEEAYYATKTALWCYLLGNWSISGLGVNPALTGADKAAAQRVLQATKDIYQRGMYWTTIPAPKLTATPETSAAVKATVKGAECYAQTFTVTTGTWSLEPVLIELAEGAPAGAKITDMDGDEISALNMNNAVYGSDGYSWKVMVVYPKDSIEGQTGTTKIALRSTVVQYELYFAKTLEADKYGNIQEYVLDTDPHISLSASAISSFSDDPPPPPPPDDPDPGDTSLRIVKLESGTEIPLAGAIFKVLYPDGESAGSFSTGTDGTVTIPIPEGKIGNLTVTEVIPPKSHLLPVHTTQNVMAIKDQAVTLTFYNDAYGTARIEKVSDTGDPLPGVTVQIKNLETGETQSGKTGPGGAIVFDNLKPGGYEVRETAGIPGWQFDGDTVKTVTVVAGETSTVTFTNKELPGLRIVKYDRATNTTMPDVTFEIWRDGESMGQFKTDQLGEILLTGQQPGTYLVQEVSAPDTHVIDTAPRQIELKAGCGIVQLVFFNSEKPKLKLIKVDAENLSKGIPNVKFSIKKVEGDSAAQEYTTDASGEIDLSKLAPGSYVVTELSCPGYVIDDAQRIIELRPDETAEFVFTNRKRPTIHLIKLSSDGTPLPGVSFRIAKIEDGTSYLDRTTDANGEIKIDNLDPGVYSVREVATDARHILNPREFHVELFPGKTSTLVVENHVRPNLYVYKLDADTGEPIPNTVFAIKAADGHSVDEIKTDATGKAALENLLPGVYEISEKHVPDDWLMDAPAQLVTLYADRDRTAYFYNHRKPTLTVNKISSVTGKALEGAKFNVTYGSNSTVTGEINDLGVYYTDANGQFTLTGLRDGWYKVSELASVEGYQPPDGLDVQTRFIGGGENAVLTFENVPLSAITVYKYDDVTGEAISGAVFEIRYLTDTSGTGGTAIGRYKTGANGSFTVTGLIRGTYIVEEIASDSGHVIDSAPQTVFLSGEDQDVVQVYFGNQPKGSVLIRKLDAITRAPLSGVQFFVTDSTGAVLGNSNGYFTTDSAGTFLIENLAPSVTVVAKEVRGISGYVLDDTPQTIQVKAGKTVTLEFLNKPKGNLVICKYDSVTKQPLPGAEFKVTMANGSLTPDNEGLTSSNGLYVTDENGQITLSKLTPATYLISESKAPEGYALDEQTQTVVVDPGDTQTVRFYDEPLATLLLLKRDAVSKLPLANAEFTVKTASGTAIGENNGLFITDEDGTATVTGIEPNTAVVVSEETAPPGYVANATPKTIVVKSGVANQLTFDDEPTTTLIIHKYIEGTNSQPLSGVGFRVTDSTGAAVGPNGGTYYTDRAGEIMLTGLAPGITVTAREFKTVDGYVLDGTPQSVLIKDYQKMELTFWNARQGGLVIRKLDSITKAPLAGAEFQLTYADGGYVGNENGHLTSNGIYTTDSKGEIRISGVTGTIVATEVKSPDGYLIGTDKTQTVTVNPADTQTLTFYNTPKQTVVIEKYAAGTNTPLPGVTFLVTDGAGAPVGSANGEHTTDANGRVVLTGLTPGMTLIVREIRTVKGYTLCGEAQTIVVGSGAASGTSGSTGGAGNTLKFYDEPLSVLVIQKYVTGTTTPIPGVRFYVTDGRGAAVGTTDGEYSTDEHGQIVLRDLEPGTVIKAKEIKAADGYVLDGGEKSITIKSGDVQMLEFFNSPTGTLILTKRDRATDKPLPGAKFQITDGTGAAIGNDGGRQTSNGEYITGEDGTIRITGLQPCTLVIREITPPDGYSLNTQPLTVEVRANDTQSVNFYDDALQTLVIQKYITGTTTPIPNVHFLLTDSTGAFIGPNNGEYVTDRNGRITISGLTPGTTVIARETTPADGYVLDGAPQSIEIKGGESQTLVFYNTPVGGLIITKSDEETGDRIPGVQFEVRKLNGEIIGQYTTDRNGVIRLPELANGWYAVIELKAASGYLLDPTPQQVEVKDGQTATLDLTNRKTSRVLIHKIDADTGKGIFGVTFLLYDADHNPIGEYVSDQDGYVYMDDGLADGRYFVCELKAADGYILDNELKTIYVQYGSTSEITWKNTAIRGQIQILKKSADDNPINGLPAGTPLEGAVFEIYDKANRLVDTVRTDRNGRAASKLLPLSRYTVKEVQAPNYYAINPTVMNAYLEHEGQIVNFEVLDESLSTGVSIKKTGYAEVMPGQPIRYTITDIANTSTVSLGSFYWRDTLPGQITLEKVITGTYNQKLAYKIVYKTNLSGDQYRTLADNLSTAKSYVLEVRPAALGLAANERVTEIMFVFGTVKAGFAEVETAYIYGRVNSGLSNGSSIVNVVDVGGLYNGQWIQGVSRWLTKVYAKTTPLPKTGY